MVEHINNQVPLTPKLKKAFLSINRELFVPFGMQYSAYKLDALPLGANQFISSPLTVARMSVYLELESSCDSVLEIGLGSGYQAAILSKMVRRVFSIERIERLLDETRIRIRDLGIMNINTKLDDGKNGWEKFAPFDRILFSAGIKEIPQKLVSQLEQNGIIVAPIIQDDSSQIITRFIKRGNSIEVFDRKETCSFVLVKDMVETL